MSQQGKPSYRKSEISKNIVDLRTVSARPIRKQSHRRQRFELARFFGFVRGRMPSLSRPLFPDVGAGFLEWREQRRSRRATDFREGHSQAEVEVPATFSFPSPAIEVDLTDDQVTERDAIRRSSWYFTSFAKLRTTLSAWSDRMHYVSELQRVRSLGVFVLGGFAILLPIQLFVVFGQIADAEQDVRNESQVALRNLQQAVGSLSMMDQPTSLSALQSAAENFQKMDDVLTQRHPFLVSAAKLIPGSGKKVQDAESMIAAGQAFVRAGKAIVASNALAGEDLVTRLQALDAALTEARPHFRETSDAVRSIDPDSLPEEARPYVVALREQLPASLIALEHFHLGTRTLSAVFASSTQRRYVILLQNNAELRPTGGFISGVALVDLDMNGIRRLEVPAGGPYDFQGYFPGQIQSPRPLWLVNPIWQLQDLNYFPDFPTSAQKVIWYFEKTQGGYSVDGVIAMTPTVIEQLLRALGEVEMNDGTTITADTLTRQLEDASQPDDPRPKQLLADVTPLVLEKALAADAVGAREVLLAISKGLADRDVQLYLKQPELQAAVKKLGWSGEVRQTDQDYLSIIRTNIAGGKTDTSVDQAVSYRVLIEEGKAPIARLKIRFDHRGQEGDGERGIRNSTYLRVYVPAGAELLSAEGFIPEAYERLYNIPPDGYVPDTDLQAIEGDSYIHEPSGTRISGEFEKTVFGNWVGVSPGESQLITLHYRLPARVISFTKNYGKYTLLHQRQAGVGPYSMDVEVVFPSLWTTAKAVGAQTETGMIRRNAIVQGKDEWMGAIFQKP
jgi:hypothetical protein